MNAHEKINYVEFAAKDLGATKEFFRKAFAWEFTDYGEDYTAFSGEGLDGGFYQADLATSAERGGALIVFYSEGLEETLEKVKKAGAEITREIFSFPGGRRFHFREPSGNEFAVWSDKGL
ncbi:VOC family protein [Roseibacillus persicicus]|uniref:VOC family protein n=1 Tax=Roseibacillus persicicus TaxID=454148 RepID=UPI00280D4061|nr:VOC family protein [Roseibacillus persicicus]MDQ8190395.1 VOC family protein [Roseibacillus persicicus]